MIVQRLSICLVNMGRALSQLHTQTFTAFTLREAITVGCAFHLPASCSLFFLHSLFSSQSPSSSSGCRGKLTSGRIETFSGKGEKGRMEWNEVNSCELGWWSGIPRKCDEKKGGRYKLTHFSWNQAQNNTKHHKGKKIVGDKQTKQATFYENRRKVHF